MKLTLHGEQISSVRDFYKIIEEQLDAPDYFGENLDALYDILTDYVSPPEVEIYEILALGEGIGAMYLLRFMAMVTDCGGEVRIR